jgi:hypothetical protein
MRKAKTSKPKREPFVSDLSATKTQYESTGRCGICLRPIEALQPGGLSPRHIEDGSRICGESRPCMYCGEPTHRAGFQTCGVRFDICRWDH